MHKRGCESEQQRRKKHLLSFLVHNALEEQREREVGLGEEGRGIGGRDDRHLLFVHI
jgi:hypothetical protein